MDLNKAITLNDTLIFRFDANNRLVDLNEEKKNFFWNVLIKGGSEGRASIFFPVELYWSRDPFPGMIVIWSQSFFGSQNVDYKVSVIYDVVTMYKIQIYGWFIETDVPKRIDYVTIDYP